MNMSPSVLDQKIFLLKSKETDNYGKEIIQLQSSHWEFLGMLVLYCCTIYHKRRDLKQHKFIISQFL